MQFDTIEDAIHLDLELTPTYFMIALYTDISGVGVSYIAVVAYTCLFMLTSLSNSL